MKRRCRGRRVGGEYRLVGECIFGGVLGSGVSYKWHCMECGYALDEDCQI
jgi:hypothetical protein